MRLQNPEFTTVSAMAIQSEHCGAISLWTRCANTLTCLAVIGATLHPLTTHAQSCATPPTGLVSWWAAEVTAADTMDNNHGTLVNGATFAAGEVGDAFSLDGTDDYVSIPASASLHVGNGPGFTLEGWIYPTDTSSQHVIAEWNNGSGGVGVHLMHSIGALGGLGSLFANIPDTSGNDHYFATAAGVLTAGNYQHVALTYDQASGSAKIYLNGSVSASATLGTFTPQTTYPLYFGTRISGGGAGSYFGGLLDEFSLYDRALDAGEIQAIHDAGTAGKCAGPIPPYLISQPTNQTVVAGSNTTFHVVAGGSGPLTYQWYFGLEALANATNFTFSLSSVGTNHAGSYSVVVTNAYGSTQSVDVTLTVVVPPCAPPSAGLVSWWRGQSNAIDAIGGNNGTVTGNAGFGNGRVGQGFVFDGNGDSIQVGNPVNLRLQNLTIEAWIRRSSSSLVTLSGGGGFLFGYSTGGYVSYMGTDGRLYFGKAGVAAYPSSASITDTNLHHIAITKSGSSVTFYIDGVLNSTTTLGDAFTFTTIAGIGGEGPGAGSSFLGAIDELGVYDRALSSVEIAAIFNGSSEGKCASSAPYVYVAPTNLSVFATAPARFAVFSGGTPPLAFQWTFKDSPLSGATSSALILPSAGPDAAGDYAVIITNLYGAATSSVASLDVTEFVSSPNLFDDLEPNFDATQWAAFGGTTMANNFGGSVSSSNSLWFGGAGSRYAITRGLTVANGSVIQFWLRFGYGTSAVWETLDLPSKAVVLEYSNSVSGAWIELTRYNTISFTNWTPVAVSAPVAAIGYPTQFRWRQLSNSGASFDHWALDDVAIFTAAMPPAFLTQPQGFTLSPGKTASFNPTVAGGALATYQWRLNGNNVPGATNASVTLTNVQPSLAGAYTLAVTNSAGFAISSGAMLKVVVLSAFASGQALTNAAHAFPGPVTVQITNAYAGGLVFYTLDGSTPTFFSAQYTGPFNLSQTSILRAIGYRSDFFESGELDPVLLQIAAPFTLAVSTPGGGSVGLNPPGGIYVSNSIVTLTATPNAGWTFLRWLGDVTGTNVTVNVTMNRNKSAQAIFGTTLGTTAAGGGDVLLNPPGGIYPFGTVVQLSAIPNTGNYFGIWGNAASGNVNPLLFTLTNANPTVSSLFAPVGGGQAGLTVVPVGRGNVSVSPRANVYATGAGVTLTASPEAGQTFLGWTGDASGTASPLVLTLNNSALIYANFTKRPRLFAFAPFSSLAQEGIQLTATGETGEVYQFESSSNCVDWVAFTVATNVAGSATFTDASGTNFNHRFYRAVTIP